MNPDILILAEPTAGLDPKGREELFGQLKKMHEESNLTIVLISHSMEDVARYAKELVVLYRGEVAFAGETREIFKHRKELEQIGLGVPQIRHIMDELKDKGMQIDNNVLTVEEAAQKLIQYFESEVK